MGDKLSALNKKIQTCKKCRLFEAASNAVPGEGDSKAKIMFIGEAPGKAEDASGKPFVGAAGKFLTKLLESAAIRREDVFITNIVKHRPPENRDPRQDEVQLCMPFLVEQIKIINPKVIVTLGRHAMYRFMPEKVISEVHGKPCKCTIGGGEYLFLPLYHPASALYNPGLRDTLFKDIKKLKKILKNDA